MPDSLSPTYHFDFGDGIVSTGALWRTSPVVAGSNVHRIRYSFDDLPLVQGLSQRMPPTVADLIDVCVAIALADRLARRETEDAPRSPDDRWHRRMHLTIPVRRPEKWEQPGVLGLLDELLSLLTDDNWNIHLTRRSLDPRPAEAQSSYLRPSSCSAVVALNSGGLDSALGLMHLLTRSVADLIFAVTVATNKRILAPASAVVRELRSVRTIEEPSLQVGHVHIRVLRDGRPKDDRESSQRARALLFLAAAVGVASVAGVHRLHVNENGVGAIGLPMTSDHWGARATKAMHPKTLALFGELASIVLEHPLTIVNGSLFITKGELAKQLLSNGRFVAAARMTVSCDRAAYLSPGHACGKCTSCILRRIALVSAGLADQIDGRALTYDCDLFSPATPFSGDNAVHLFAMREQVERLRAALAAGEDFSHLDRAFPALIDVVALAPTLGLSAADVAGNLTRLYRAYVREFDTLVDRIDRPGWGCKGDPVPLRTSISEAAVG